MSPINVTRSRVALVADMDLSSICYILYGQVGVCEPDERDVEPGGAGGGHGHVFYILYTLWPGKQVDVCEPNECDAEPGGAGGGHGHVFYILYTLWPGGRT